MRFEGKLDKWNDDRGFGFITPSRGGEPVFVHVSAFPRDGQRPQLGEALTFEVEPAREGKKQAIRVERPGAQPRMRPARPAGESSSHRSHRPRTRSSFVGAALTVALVAGGGGFVYSQLGGFRAGRSAPSTGEARVPDASQNASSAFRCDGRTHCSQMTSCAEAKFFLDNCPNTQMDGNRDGIPCEKQWCTSPLSR
jgi:cold shock CspA family protein